MNINAKYFLGLFLLSASLQAFAFDYHGIKSGMAANEVNSQIGCTEYCSSIDYRQIETFFGEENRPPALWTMSFSYTSDDKLWRIQLSFIERSGTGGVAQQRILAELYPDADLQKSSSSNEYGTTNFINALLVDNTLFKRDVEKIYNETKSKY